MKIYKEKFGAKVFVAFTIFIFLISFSFTAYYIHHQRISLTDTLTSKGKLLSGVLAYTSRIGIFSESGELLRDPVDGIFQHQDVLEVSIFNTEGKLIAHRAKSQNHIKGSETRRNESPRKELINTIKSQGITSFELETGRREFWSPVWSEASYASMESLLFDPDQSRKKDRLIGFVKITLDRTVIDRQYKDLLLKSILIGIAFLILGSGGTYFVVKKVTRPLNRLTEGVKTLGSGGVVDKVPVETEDEIGKLAGAFNNMSESLKERENALRESEKRLRLLSSRLLTAQEQERKRISKGLHDEMGQSLALLKHQIRSVQRKLPDGQVLLRDECDEIGGYIDQIIENVRRLSRDLSPLILEDLGLSAALKWLIENFKKQYLVQTSVSIDNIDHLFSQEIQTNIYRIFQEALTNVGKHAQAGQVAFTVNRNQSGFHFILKDDGNGFDLKKAMDRNFSERGLGLDAMDERAHMMGAALKIHSRIGDGTSITLKLTA
ncbi:HAMP domain-containing protein [Thermodesulfobacteriota bacterium]